MDEFFHWIDGFNGYYLFLGAFAIVAVWEGLLPARKPIASTTSRWVNNLLWLFLNNLVIRWVFPFLSVAWASHVGTHEWGLFNQTSLPEVLQFLLGICLLDLGGYLLHVALHKNSLLWRVHSVHHSDMDFDCTTGFRFHPIEAIISNLWRLAIISAFGLNPFIVAVYEFWVAMQNLYGHANASFPPHVEKFLRWLIITPDTHRVHHSANQAEYDSNYGIVFPWWDRLFHSYRQLPVNYQKTMPIGLALHTEETFKSLPWLLWLPLSSSFKERTDP